MESTLVIVALWLAFGLTHIVAASVRLRPKLVSRLGEQGYLGAYSVVALAIFVPLCWYYFTHRHEGPLFWMVSTGPVLLWTTYLLQGVAWVLVVAGLVQPSAVMTSTLPPGSVASTEVRGASRLTRHPLFMGFGLFGALHLISNGFASDVAFFGGLPLFAVIGSLHQDARKLATEGEGFRAWYAATPFVPLTGPVSGTLAGLRELPIAAWVGGIGLTIVLRWLHTPLFR